MANIPNCKLLKQEPSVDINTFDSDARSNNISYSAMPDTESEKCGDKIEDVNNQTALIDDNKTCSMVIEDIINKVIENDKNQRLQFSLLCPNFASQMIKLLLKQHQSDNENQQSKITVVETRSLNDGTGSSHTSENESVSNEKSTALLTTSTGNKGSACLNIKAENVTYNHNVDQSECSPNGYADKVGKIFKNFYDSTKSFDGCQADLNTDKNTVPFYQCNLCHSAHHNMSNLIAHITEHIQCLQTPFQCKICLNAFASPHQLADHCLTTHTSNVRGPLGGIAIPVPPEVEKLKPKSSKQKCSEQRPADAKTVSQKSKQNRANDRNVPRFQTAAELCESDVPVYTRSGRPLRKAALTAVKLMNDIVDGTKAESSTPVDNENAPDEFGNESVTLPNSEVLLRKANRGKKRKAPPTRAAFRHVFSRTAPIPQREESSMLIPQIPYRPILPKITGNGMDCTSTLSQIKLPMSPPKRKKRSSKMDKNMPSESFQVPEYEKGACSLLAAVAKRAADTSPKKKTDEHLLRNLSTSSSGIIDHVSVKAEALRNVSTSSSGIIDHVSVKAEALNSISSDKLKLAASTLSPTTNNSIGSQDKASSAVSPTSGLASGFPTKKKKGQLTSLQSIVNKLTNAAASKGLVSPPVPQTDITSLSKSLAVQGNNSESHPVRPMLVSDSNTSNSRNNVQVDNSCEALYPAGSDQQKHGCADTVPAVPDMSSSAMLLDLLTKAGNRQSNVNSVPTFVLPEPQKFTCEQCGATFGKKDSLRKHNQVHNRSKEEDPSTLYHCSYCSASYKNRTAVRAHEKRHPESQRKASLTRTQRKLNENQHKWQINQRRQNSAGSHGTSTESQYTVTENGEFQCTPCRYQTHSQNLFNQHVRDHQLGNTILFTCEYCEQTFPNVNSLKAHRMRHAMWKTAGSFKCDLCGEHFSSSIAVDTHMARCRLNVSAGTSEGYLKQLKTITKGFQNCSPALVKELFIADGKESTQCSTLRNLLETSDQPTEASFKQAFSDSRQETTEQIQEDLTSDSSADSTQISLHDESSSLESDSDKEDLQPVAVYETADQALKTIDYMLIGDYNENGMSCSNSDDYIDVKPEVISFNNDSENSDFYSVECASNYMKSEPIE